MAEPQNQDPQQIDRPAQYPTATRIENGTAYDISGKALGPVEGQQSEVAQPKDDDFFAKLGGKPVEGGTSQETSQEKGDDFFAKLGGKLVEGPAPIGPGDYQTRRGGPILNLAKTPEEQPIPSENRGVLASAKQWTIGQVTGMYHAFADPATEQEKQDLLQKIREQNTKFGDKIPETLATEPSLATLAFHRLIDAPADELANKGHDERAAARNLMARGDILGAVDKYGGGVMDTAASYVPMIGPMLASTADKFNRGDYSGGVTDMAFMWLFAKAPEYLKEKMTPDIKLLAKSNAVHSSAESMFEQRMREQVNATEQATRARMDAEREKQNVAEGTGSQQTLDAANDRASAAAANTRKASQALTEAGEGRAQAKIEVDRVQRRIARSTAKVDAAKVQERAGALEDFKSMAPPTRRGAGAYTDDDLSVARTYIEDAHAAKPITDTEGMYHALDEAGTSIDNQIDPHIDRYEKEPIKANVKMEVADKLAEHSEDFLNKGLKVLNEHNITDMNMGEGRKLLKNLNATNRTILNRFFPGSMEIATLLRTDPEFAANYYAQEAIRNGIDGTLQDHGVNGIRELRRDQASIYRVKEAVAKQLQRGDQPVRGSGQSGSMRRAAAYATKRGLTVAGGGTGAVAGSVFGPGGAAVGGGIGSIIGNVAGEKLGRLWTPGDLTRDQLAARSAPIKGAGRPMNRMTGVGTPSSLPVFETPAPIPASPMSPEDIQKIQREMSPLHGELATHYGEHVTDASYEELEKRFMEDLDDKRLHGVTLENPEKTLLGKINQQNAADRLAAQKAAQETIASGKRPVGQATLPENAEPAMQVMGNIPHKLNTHEVLIHELAHAVVGDEKGIVINEIRSHNHSANVKLGRFASAGVDWDASGLLKKEGGLDLNKIRDRMPDIAATYVAGGVANDLWHNVPFTVNKGLGADFAALRELMTDAGFTKLEASRMIAQAADDASQTLSRPGVRDVLEQHAEVREPGLSDKLHFSEDRLQQIYQDVKGGTNEPTGKSTGPTRTGNEGPGKTGAGTEGTVQGGAAKELRQESEGPSKEKGTRAAAEPTAPGDRRASAGPGASVTKPEHPAFFHEPDVDEVEEEEAERRRTAWSPIGRQLEEPGAPWEPVRRIQGGHAGGGVASEEELARPGRFVKISRSGVPTDQGKVPDFNLAAGEAGYQVTPGGKYELKAGQETPATKRGVESYAKEVYNPAMSAEKPRLSDILPELKNNPALEQKMKDLGFERFLQREYMAQHNAPAAPAGPVAPGAAAPIEETGPKAIVESQGLKYKGELVKGSNVHMFEHPEHPGKTAALEGPLTEAAVREKMASKLKEFGIEIPKGQLDVSRHADEFNKINGRPEIDTKTKPHDVEFAKRVADAYDQMQHNPNDPKVKAAYDAMKNDVDKQWDYATKQMGVKFEPWAKEGQPYANSKEMVEDVKNNKHLYFFQGGESPADNPLQVTDPKTGLSYNDKFRAVHDLFGHAAQGNQFGPKGEETAYQLHRQMFSPEAIPALTSETRGQNSWVNFGRHLRTPEGNIPVKGEAGHVPVTERPYAEQKTGILPEEFHTATPGIKQWHEHAAARAAVEPAGAMDPHHTVRETEGIGTEILPEARLPLDHVPTAEDFRAFKERHEDLFGANPQLKIGWGNNSRVPGGHELNIGASGPGAVEVARKLGQRAAFDIGKGEDIPTGGTGLETKFPGYPLEQRLADLNKKPLPESPAMSRPAGSSVPLMQNPLKVKGTGEEGNITTTDVAQELSKFTKKKIGALKFGQTNTAEQIARAKSLADDEARYQLAQNNTGAAWYTTDMNKHDQIIQSIRPELADPAKMSLFKMSEAVLSSGQKPSSNVTSALRSWDHYQETGKFSPFNPDTRKSWGPRGIPAYGNALDSMNRLIAEHGEKGASDWLLQNHPIKELRDYNPWVDGNQNDVLPGAYILGPKRGPFAQNLHGLESAFTADLWVARTWNRWMGTAELAPDNELLTDRPRSGRERNLMKQSFSETAQKLGMSTSSLQAVLWYYEQALYRAHGLPKVESWSFSKAAQQAADDEASTFKFGANALRSQQ